jgi:signal peptidase I
MCKEEKSLQEPDSLPPDTKTSYFLGEILESVVIAVVLAVIIRVFLFQPFYIPSGSMEPTLTEGDRIIVSKINYRLGQPKRWDIIVFKYPVDPKRDFIKRMTGLPGETVQIQDSTIYIDGNKVEQSFLPVGLRYNDYGPIKIPEGQYFMMGDNRNNSEDSRVWGTLPKGNIVGKALFIYWPINRIQMLK